MRERNSELIDSTCAGCGQKSDAAACITSDSKPTVGMLVVCAYCRSFMKFVAGPNGSLQTELLTPDEIADLPADIRALMVRTRNALREVLPNKKDSHG